MAKGRAVAIELNDVVRRELTAFTRKHGAPQALAERARILVKWAHHVFRGFHRSAASLSAFPNP